MYKLLYYTITIALSVLTGSASIAQTPTIAWQKCFGGSGDEMGSAILETSAGDFVICGSSDSPASGDKQQNSFGYLDFWTIKLSPDGSIIWEKTFGGSDMDLASVIVETPDHGYLIGGSSSSPISGNKTSTNYGGHDIWLIKLDSNGNEEWQQTYGGILDDGLADIAITNNGYLLAGSSSSPISGNKTVDTIGSADFWIIEIDFQGNIQNQHVYGGVKGDYAVNMLPYKGNYFILSGNSNSDISGDKQQNSFGESDYWIIKTDLQANILSSNTFGGNNFDSFGGSIINSNNEIYLYGESLSDISGVKTATKFGSFDLWIVKLDSSLNKIWDVSFGGDQWERFAGHSALYSNQMDLLIIAGLSHSSISGNKTIPSFGNDDFWIIGTDNYGDKAFEFVAGGTSFDRPLNMLETSSGRILVLGLSASEISGNKSEPNKGGADIWLVELDFNLSIKKVAVEDDMIVYPVPSKTMLFFSSPVGETLATTSISDLQGHVLLCQEGLLSREDNRIDVSNLAAGVYILSITGDSFRYSRKIVIE